MLLGSEWPGGVWLGWALLVGVVTMLLGLYLLRRFDRYYPRLS